MQRGDAARSEAQQDLLFTHLHQHQPITRAEGAGADHLDHLRVTRTHLLYAAQQPGQHEDQANHQQQPQHQLGQLATEAAADRRRRGGRLGHRLCGPSAQWQRDQQSHHQPLHISATS